MTLRERAEQHAAQHDQECKRSIGEAKKCIADAYEAGWTAALKEAASYCQDQAEINERIAIERIDKAKDETDRDLACIHRTMGSTYYNASVGIRKLAEART